MRRKRLLKSKPEAAIVALSLILGACTLEEFLAGPSKQDAVSEAPAETTGDEQAVPEASAETAGNESAVPDASAGTTGNEQAVLNAPAEASSDDVASLPLAPRTGTSGDRRAEPALRQEMMPVDDNPDQLLGQSNIQVHALLGEPKLIRRDGPAEIWQYRATNCILDVFLYEGGTARTVRHVDLRGPGTAMPERRACFARMLTDQRAAAG